VSRPLARRLAVLTAVSACVAAAAMPALADGVSVSLADDPGSRQFAVQDISGNPLTAVNLGTGGAQPFRTVVTDTKFRNLTKGYNVSATMNNLYLQKSDGTSDYTARVRSSDVSLQYGTSPLSALGVSFPVVPKLTVSGVLQTCASLSPTVQSVLGLSSTGLPLNALDSALVNLCSALTTAAGHTATATVDSTVQQITSDLTSALSLGDLPTALTGATPGAFTNPDYSAGTIGAGDPARSGAAPATSLGIMTGTPGMRAALQSVISTKVNAALAGLPLTGATGPAQTTVAALLAALGSSSDAAVANVATALGVLDAARQSAVLNTLTSTVNVPALTDLVNLSAQYFGFPILKATPSAPLAGTYKGTMTVTFVQQ
jgi:hypothetical protein